MRQDSTKRGTAKRARIVNPFPFMEDLLTKEPRGVCLQRREAAHRDVQAFCEALEKGNPRNVG